MIDASACRLLFLTIAVLQWIVTISAQSPPTPVFATNYHVKGVLSLPYAELNEPFEAWYDKKGTRSRTQYYGDLYQIFQFGPKSAPENAGNTFGSMYKLVYVPSSFSSQKESFLSNLYSRIEHLAHRQEGKQEKSYTKRVCFGIHGDVGQTVGPQTVLPRLDEFSYDSSGRCPHANWEHRHARCELWTYVNFVGDKKNTYKMWISRNNETGEVSPVLYHMLGYDSLLGSHYDRYDIAYYNFEAQAAKDGDFLLDVTHLNCGSMPGPGDSDGARRSHMIVQNPIHEFVIEPYRYDHIDHEFSQFADKHGKEYESDTHHRQGWLNFMHNFRFINGKNRELKQYKLGVNKFADNNPRDLSYLRGRLHSNSSREDIKYLTYHMMYKEDGQKQNKLPESWDWSIRGAVTPVKDQAVCGSCWSFGTSGTIEGAYFVKTGKLPRLSQQQMIDCSWKYANNGCDGGEDFRAYNYIMNVGGLATEEDYGPYLGVDGKCHDNMVNKTVKLKGFHSINPGDVVSMKHALLKYGPVTVAIDASRPTFTFYSHGVYYDKECKNNPNELDHQVLVVGYTEMAGQLVWQVKNSWSTNWGDNGYIMMSAKDNNCGVLDAPTVPIIDV